ncbi:MAG: hypothetical protein ACK55Z_10115, partial [bacterium]
NVLLYRVRLGQHVQDFPLVHSLLHPVSVALFFHVYNFIPFCMQHLLASFKGSFKFLLFLAAFAELPLRLVNNVLLQADCF